MDEHTPEKEKAADDEVEETDQDELKALVLTKRDLALFKLVHEQRYLAFSHIKRAFWPDRSLPAKACYKRLTRLEKNGYLKQIYSKRKGLNLYLLTERSFQEIKNEGLDSGVSLYKPTEYFDRYTGHDLKVATIRILFQELGLTEWTSERFIRAKTFGSRIPDGILKVRGQKIAVELENFLTKGKKRYIDLFDFYKRRLDYFLVFMIISGDTKEWVIELNYNPQQVWIATYKELLEKKEEALFENKRAHFTLARIL